MSNEPSSIAESRRVAEKAPPGSRWPQLDRRWPLLRKSSSAALACVVLLVLLAQTGASASLPTDRTADASAPFVAQLASRLSYQGQLTDALGAPLNGLHNLTFQLWDDESGGAQVGGDIVKNGVQVADGLFTVALDVPPTAFNGRALWLRIGVDGLWLAPRQELLASPYALGLRPGARIEGDGESAMATIVNHGMGPALEAQGAAVGVIGSGMTGIEGSGDVGVSGSGLVGVLGASEIGRGVEGRSGPSSGVYGESTGGNGVEGQSQLEYGVYGRSAGGFGAGVGGSGATGVSGTGAVVGVSGYTEAEGMTGVLGTAKGNGGKAIVGTANGLGGIGLAAEAEFGTGVMAEGEIGLRANGSVGAGIMAEGPMAIVARGKVGDGISAISDGGPDSAALRAEAQGKGYGGYFTSIDSAAVHAVGFEGLHAESTTAGGMGVHGTGTTGVRGDGSLVGLVGSGSAAGVMASSTSGNGVVAQGSGQWAGNAALKAQNDNPSEGMAAYFTNQSNFHTAHIENNGSGGVFYLRNNGDDSGAGGGDFVTAVGRNAEGQFRVTSSGQARSDVGFTTPAEDFAEMVPAVAGLEPGDVLVIGPDARMLRSSQPYQPSVAGVYSTAPGFVGGEPVGGSDVGEIPLAIVGLVPVKVSAENGAIRPGDLLVAASTPGHAMRAGSNPPPGTVIGKALGRLDSGTGRIRMLASLQ